MIFVIADEYHGAVIAGKGRHAVGPRRHPQTIIHRFAFTGDDRVDEALRQIEYGVRIRTQRPEAGAGRASLGRA